MLCRSPQRAAHRAAAAVVAEAVAVAASRRAAAAGAARPPLLSPRAVLRLAAAAERRPHARGLATAAGAREVAASDWDPSSFRDLLQQVATEGKVEEPLLSRLRGASVATAAPAGVEAEQPVEEEPAEAPAVEAAAGEQEGKKKKKGKKKEEKPKGEEAAVPAAPAEVRLVECEPGDLVSVAELCAARRLRDYVLLSALAARLADGTIRAQASTDVLRRIATAYSTLGALNPPLFESIAAAYLSAWGAASGATDTEHLVAVARAFSAQRMRHEELFDALRKQLQQGGAEAANPEQALSLLHSHAYLRLGEDLGELWSTLEQKAAAPGLAELGAGPLAELCYVLVLSRRSDAREQELAAMLEVLADLVLKAGDSHWSTPDGAALYKRVLLLRSVMRYVYRDTYRTLPAKVVQAFRRVHRMESPNSTAKPAVNFIRKVSHSLTKMKIGHFVNAEHGAFVFDIIERDRKLIYECNHFDRYYVGTTEKIAPMCLQERVAKAMGYRVVQVPHWHWGRICNKKQRMSYLRMSRYYAIKDRREISPRDEVPTDVAMNEFDFMGEYFFRKDSPAAHWSWFQPRYDYKDRLPATS